MKLLLIRHAQTTANHEGRWQGHSDFPLSALGHAQTARLAEAVAGYLGAEIGQPPHSTHPSAKPVVVYSSPLGRAQATAQPLAAAVGQPVETLEPLREYDVGVFSGRTWAELEARHPDVARHFAQHRDWDAVPDAEPLQQRSNRARSAIDQLINNHDDQQTVVGITHGGFLQYLIAALLGTPRVWGIRPGNTAIFEFHINRKAYHRQTASAGALNSYHCRIQRFNDTTHLNADAHGTHRGID
ncbi:histidine phosphatase family protein [Spiribacter pallidus]|uniref:Histidine phosphatase family protein n=1 Tax=Spiribacter pallidus TaxID=1987936 RepID=A0ABV3TAL4_9GAMM